MNNQEKLYFDALSRDREESADTLEKPSMRGVKNSVVEKYSDQAHFIYELLQNADDALATSARFVLEPDRLIFAHNGTRFFSITNPEKEDIDSENGTLGDINAITSIANSNKTTASIGKFGVGFKAVFQYTSTPRIYDPLFRFRIDRFIVPVVIEDDFPGRKKDETLFVFPFDHPERDEDEAFEDIGTKLKSLIFPLLFLTNLKTIQYEIGSLRGAYGKSIRLRKTQGDIIAENIRLSQMIGNEFNTEDLWLFSSLDEENRRYSVGFFLNEEGKLKPYNEPAFCFFPTKEVTGLNFIVHAPFLLTDSREGIRAGVQHNNRMIGRLAELSARSLVFLRDIGIETSNLLIDDNIINIIPVDPNQFSNPLDRRKVSFLPFYRAIENVFKEDTLLPSTEGYASPNQAYWGEFPQLPQLFSNSQLAEIVQNTEAMWVFPSLSRYDCNRYNKPLCTYIESLTRTVINEDAIITGRKRVSARWDKIALEAVQGITPEFIERQPVSWLHEFYKWLADTKHRTEISKDKPILLDQNLKASSAYDSKGHLVLFLPVDGMDTSGYSVVHSDLLSNQETRQFIESLGVTQPSLRDQIYNIILPLYRKCVEVDADAYFNLLFKYYRKCSNDEVSEFINLIREYQILVYTDKDGNKKMGRADSMYLPTPELRAFLQAKEDVRFVDLEEYKRRVGTTYEELLIEFLLKLGVKNEIEILNVAFDFASSERADLPTPYSTRKQVFYSERRIDGCAELVKWIVRKKDVTKSFVLWNCLLKIIESDGSAWHYKSLSTLLKGNCQYFYRSWRTESFESSDAIALKNNPWICNNDGEFVTPCSITVNELPRQYLRESLSAKELISFLQIKDISEEEKEEDDSNLTESQREKIQLANKLKEFGIEDASELEEILAIKRERDARRQEEENQFTGSHSGEGHTTFSGNDEANENEDAVGNSEKNSDSDFEDFLNDEDGSREEFDDNACASSSQNEDNQESDTEKKNSKIRKQKTRDVVKDIYKRANDKKNITSEDDNQTGDKETEEPDEDDLIHSSVDYQKKIEKAKEKSAAEVRKIAYLEELQTKALEAQKYTFAWFNALLELESINSGEANANSREVSISFSVVEKAPGTKRTLILKYPNRYIPQFMEDLADIPLILHLGDQKRTVPIEVASIKSYTLHVKMKREEDIAGIDLTSVNAATIDAKSPVFLIEELRKAFADLEYEDDYDMQMNLPENLEFVFGPPGTGKTTHLAKDILMPMMGENTNCKVLVLTPTNKASDVLVRRIMELSGERKDYESWLVRFGATAEEDIEQSPVFRDKTFDIRTLSKSVTITTIARFPYDFFMPHNNRLYLKELKWDYIVFDEASMIPIANIIYPIYKKTPQKFIIAGDPFQIEPITSVDLWKNENIYTMVQLDSFVNPITIPHQYKVDLLTTQYRSIPAIGEIFSQFAYGGVLKHHREAKEQRALHLGEKNGIKTLNIIKYPVSKYESIYRPKRLQHSSSYQIYSALFTFEYVCYLSREIAKNNPNELYKIGVIAPYRAEADIINKLMASEKLPKEVTVEVGTIHGFQGDECDIIFAVFNTPPTISASKEMFLNKKNIINVSISRARDYLFVVMPDNNTEKIENLKLVKRVENLIRKAETWAGFLSPDLENLMFGDPKYLENNAFSTSHQSVNVYGLPEKCYEVRAEDAAVDVQIHKPVRDATYNRTEKTAESEKLKPETDNLRFAKGASPTTSPQSDKDISASGEGQSKVEAGDSEHSQQTSHSETDKRTPGLDEYVDSYDLDEELIPESLRKEAIDLPVRGAIKGWCYLVPYEGKLKSHTVKKTIPMFIPLMRDGQEKMVSVLVVGDDRIIYISRDMFKLYEQGLSEPDGIEVRRNFFS